MYKSASVIGSGFGGLAAAIRLQAAGTQTTIFERASVAGGRAGLRQQDGFTFDTGPTVLTAPDCISELFELAGKNTDDYYQLQKVDPMYRLVWQSGETFDYYQETGPLIDEIARFSIADAENYSKYYRYTRELFDKGYKELGDVAFLGLGDMLKAAPHLIRLRAFESVYRGVSRYFKHPQIRQAFSFNSLLVGGHPFRASSIYSLIHALEREWGTWYPKGGMHALIRALVKLFEDLGGKIEYNSTVSSITTNQNRISGVQIEGREFFPCEAVVSNGDVYHTYATLLEHPRGKQVAGKLKKMRFSPSLFVMYFGTKRKYSQLKQHTVIFGDRYKELIDDIFDGDDIPRDASLYLHAASRTDESLAPEGCESMYVLAPVPNLHKVDIDWNRYAESYGNRIISMLERTVLPGLSANITARSHLTPVNFRDDLLSHQGAAFSLEPLLTQSASFRVKNRDAKVSGLYFVGAGTHPGAGIPGVVASAKATTRLMVPEAEKSGQHVSETQYAGS